MPRVAIVADSHFDQHSRFAECQRIHDWIAEDIAERDVDLVLHSGDVYERKSTPVERQAVARWVQRVAATAPVVIARGNHDAIDDLPLLERLETRRPVRVFEGAGVVELGGCALAVLAWPQRGLLHRLLPERSKEEVEQAAGEALRAVLRGLGAQLQDCPPDAPRILLSHAMVRGSRVSTGQPLVGCDFEIGLEDLALVEADFYALGHIHMGQSWDVGGKMAVYPGSPRRTAFGESESKGYVIAEFNGRDLVGWERIETPATPMVHLLAEYVDDNLVPHPDWPSVEGAEVRLRYNVESRHREAAKDRGLALRDELLSQGAISVKLEEQIVVEHRTRAPGVATATTLADKLERLWESKAFDPGERKDALLGKVNQLETDDAA